MENKTEFDKEIGSVADGEQAVKEEHIEPTDSIHYLMELIHDNSTKKGFWDKRGQTTFIAAMLMHVTSELGEAYEAQAKGKSIDINSATEMMLSNAVGDKFIGLFEQNIRGTWEEEVADAIIVLLDICAGASIPIQDILAWKIKYNVSRSRLHGKTH